MRQRRPRHYDRDGLPMTFEDWTGRFEDLRYRLVERTDFPDGSFVSTVWMGLDHSFGDGPPLIFETMDMPGQDIQHRYSTVEQARAGHTEAVAEYLKLHPELAQ